MINDSEKLDVPISNPEAEILSIKAEMAVMGANDYEYGAIEDILKDFRENKITAEEAIQKAKSILASKQDYH